MKQPPNEPQLRALADLLTGPGIERGLVGPREADRIWERHILNCAAVPLAPGVVPADAQVVDVGSGAGLPGLVWAIMRPDLTITLVESLLRRTTFLTEAVEELGLGDRVIVLRSRAEDVTGIQADVATARAVAPLSRLLPWLRPLVIPGGWIVAMKGASVADEVAAAAPHARRLGLAPAVIEQVGAELIDPPTTIVRYRVTTT